MSFDRESTARLAPELDKLLANERPLRGPPPAVAQRLSERLALSLGEPVRRAPLAPRMWPQVMVMAAGVALFTGGLVRMNQGAAAPSDSFASQPRTPFVRVILQRPPHARGVAASALSEVRAPALTIASHVTAARAPEPPVVSASDKSVADKLVPAKSVPHKSVTDEADLLQREATLLESARAALLARDFTAADMALAAHEKEFLRGQLAEERDAVRIRLLLARGDDRAASAYAQQFLNRYPTSALRFEIASLITEPTP